MAVSHRDVCKGGDGCCSDCGHHSYAADDGRCLYCHSTGGSGVREAAPVVKQASPPARFKPARNARQAIMQRAYFADRGREAPEDLAAAIDRHHP